MEASLAAEHLVATAIGSPLNAYPDEVSQALSGMSKFQLYEVLSQLKAMDQQDSGKVRRSGGEHFIK